MKVNDYEIKRYANLRYANLHGADLRYADLRGADLHGADLRGANLRGADLHGANLRYADLRDADLRDADLRDANLRGADLRGADLHGANLRYANLHGADLRYADLHDTKGLVQFCILPEGDLIGYKRASSSIIKVRIPAEAKRVNAYSSRKCRAEYVEVLEAPEGGATGNYDLSIVYKTGERVTADKFDPDPRVECSHGIHFFITRQEAEDY